MSNELSRICLTVVMPASGRKKPKWLGKSCIGAGDRFAVAQVFRLEVLAVRGEDELGLLPGRGGAGFKFRQRFRHLPGTAHGDVDVVVWRTPRQRRILFDSPLRRRLRVVSLLPKAARNA